MHDPSVSLWDLRTIPLWSKWTKDLTLYCLNKIKEIMILVLQKGYKTDYLVNRHNMMGTVSKLYVSNNTWILCIYKKNLYKISTPIPTPESFNSNSNSNSGSFNSNSNSGKSLEYQLQLQEFQLQLQLQRFQLQFQLQLRSWSWNWTQLQLQLRSWPQPWQAIIRANVNTDLCHHMASLGLEATMYENWKSF